MYSLGLISKYRTQLMGCSAILILLCHAPTYVDFPSIISAIFSRGGCGVDIFLFLSGVGLWYSLSRSPQIKLWYKIRFIRLLVPYLLIFAPLTIIRGFMEHIDIINVIGDITTISFWTRHSSAWFVAVLVPLYLFAPLIFNYFRKAHTNSTRFLRLLVLISLCIVFGSIKRDMVEYKSFIYNFQFALYRIPTFIFGLFLGPYIAQNYKCRFPILINLFLCLIAVVLKHYIPKLPISIFLFVPLLMIMSLFFSKELVLFNRVASFMGRISLESYLFNVTLPFFIIRSNIFCNLFDNYVLYLIVTIIGVLLSIIISRISHVIIGKFTNLIV